MRHALPALLLAACTLEDVPDPPVRLRVELESTAGITGALDLLARNVRTEEAYGYELDPRGIHLPDAGYHRVRVYQHGCHRELPFDYVYADLEELRMVGDEAHFFSRAFVVDGKPTPVDIVTAYASLTIDPYAYDAEVFPFGESIIIHAPDLADGSPGAREACAELVAPTRP